MKILIPKENPLKSSSSGYIHAIETLEKRAYYPHEFERDSLVNGPEWVYFNREIVSNSYVKSFFLTDFYVLDSEDISPLERVIYGI